MAPIKNTFMELYSLASYTYIQIILQWEFFLLLYILYYDVAYLFMCGLCCWHYCVDGWMDALIYYRETLFTLIY